MDEGAALEKDQGVLAVGRLGLSQQCALEPKGQPYPGGTRPSAATGQGRGCPDLLCAVRPHLQHWYMLGNKKNIKLLESVQRRATKVVKGLKGKTNKKQLRSLGLFSAEQTMLRGRPHGGLQLLTGSGGAALSSALW